MPKKSKYTLELCIHDAAKYSSLKDWRTTSSATYKAAHRLGWLEQCANNFEKKYHIWTKEECILDAQKYQTRKEWRSTASGNRAYNAAHRNRWLNECVTHMIGAIKGTKKINWSHLSFKYDDERNNIDKKELTAGSHFDAWWICVKDNNHRIKKQIRNVVRGYNCPYCKEEVYDGKNSIKELSNEWISEWDFSKNQSISPAEITRKYPNKVWWHCENNHSWSESPKRRLSNNIGCRICNQLRGLDSTNKRIIERKGSLLDAIPQIQKYWAEDNLMLASDLPPGSNKTIWLNRPSDGELISTSPKALTRSSDVLDKEIGIIKKQTSMPHRADSFAARHPELMNEWLDSNSRAPDSIAEFSGYLADWCCSNCGYKWKTTIASRSSGRGCPKCSKKVGSQKRIAQKVEKDGSASERFPNLRKEWHPVKNSGVDLENKTAKSGFLAWWQCDYGHEWRASIANRTAGSACPLCAGRGSKIELRVMSEMEFFFDEIIWQFRNECGELDIYLPQIKTGIEVDGYPWHKGKGDKDQGKTARFYENGIRVVRLRDSRLTEEVSDSVIFDNHLGDKGIYKGIIKLIKLIVESEELINSYALHGQFVFEDRYKEQLTRYPRPPDGRAISDSLSKEDLAWDYELNHPITPDMVYAGSNTQYWFNCPKHENYQTTPKSRARGTGCKQCGYEQASLKKGQNTPLDQALSEYINLLPVKLINQDTLNLQHLSINSHKKCDWTCSRGHIWNRSIRDIVNRPICPQCRVYEGSVLVKTPLYAEWWDQEKNELKPSEVLAGSGKRYYWKCRCCNHEWVDTPAQITTKKGKSCPLCKAKPG